MNKNFLFQILLDKNLFTISSMILSTTFISQGRIRVWKNGMFQSGIGSGLERGLERGLEKQTEYLMMELTVNTTR